MENIMTIEELNKLVLEAKNFYELENKIIELGYKEVEIYEDGDNSHYIFEARDYFYTCDKKAQKKTQEKKCINEYNENSKIYGKLNDKYFRIDEVIKKEEQVSSFGRYGIYYIDKNVELLKELDVNLLENLKYICIEKEDKELIPDIMAFINNDKYKETLLEYIKQGRTKIIMQDIIDFCIMLSELKEGENVQKLLTKEKKKKEFESQEEKLLDYLRNAFEFSDFFSIYDYIADNAEYHSNWGDKDIYGKKDIIESIKKVNEERLEIKEFLYVRKITIIENDNNLSLKPVGTRGLRIENKDEQGALVFIQINAEGKIENIDIESNKEYVYASLKKEDYFVRDNKIVFKIKDINKYTIFQNKDTSKKAIGIEKGVGNLCLIDKDKMESIRLPFEFDDTPVDATLNIGCYDNGLIMVSLLDYLDFELNYIRKRNLYLGIWGWIDEDFNIVIRPQYIFAENFVNGKARVCWCKTIEFKDNDDGEQDAIWDREMWGVIDTKGNEIIPCKYDELYCVKNSDNIFLVFENKKYNFITIDSETILELDFDFNMDYSASECFILEERYIVMKKQELEENQDYVKEFAYIYIYDLLDKKYIVYNSEINAQEVKDKINKDCKNIDIILNQIKE